MAIAWFEQLIVLHALDAGELRKLPADALFPCLLWDDLGAWSAELKLLFARTLIVRGCRYAVCGGAAGESWHEAFDLAFLDEFGCASESEQKANHVMTTSHVDESIDEVAYFFTHLTSFDRHEFSRFVVASVSDPPTRAEVVERVGYWLIERRRDSSTDRR